MKFRLIVAQQTHFYSLSGKQLWLWSPGVVSSANIVIKITLSSQQSFFARVATLSVSDLWGLGTRYMYVPKLDPFNVTFFYGDDFENTL